MESIIIDVVNTFDEETSKKRVKIRHIQGYAYGYPLHEVSGKLINCVPVNNGMNLNFSCNGGKAKRLRTIFDPVGLELDDKADSIIAIPVIRFVNDYLSWHYEAYAYQNLDEAFDKKMQPIDITIKDFDLREWEHGVQKIPVSFSPYRSGRTGKTGMNYIASSKQYIERV